jgi:type II secretory pathway predicted ATPase ExeA
MVVTADYPHLHPSTRPFAAEDQATRIQRIRMDRWIAYARAEAALTALEDLLTFPKRLRMPNLLLVGPTNNGKTMIVEKFRRAHLAVDAADAQDGAAIVPVVKMQMPAGPDEGRFFSAILDALGMPYAPRERIAAKQDLAMRMLRATGARLIVIDELHNLLSGASGQQRRLLNLLRWLGNELQIPLVGVGTAEALRAIRSDDQLANRFEPFSLPLWTDDDAYQRLLITLEAVLPLRRPSGLAEPAMAGKILSASEGVLGEIIATVTRAAVLAVISGAEAITPRMIDGSGFIRPSERRRVAV